MKIKNALISTVATVSALGVIGSFAGGNDTAAEPMDTVAESHSVEVVILEPGDYPPSYTLDITTQIETEPPAPVTQPPETEPPKPTTQAPETEPPAPVTQAPVTEPPKPVTEPPAPVTQPPVVTEAPKPVTPPPVVTEAPKQVLDILSVSSPIKGGQNATLSAKGKPNTAYDIKVVYSSGESSAKGLEDKTSDANGNVSWTWKVGAKTKPGTYTITVKGGGETDTIKITVTD
jgi:outer membrane biosynthesis protein TonB